MNTSQKNFDKKAKSLQKAAEVPTTRTTGVLY